MKYTMKGIAKYLVIVAISSVFAFYAGSRYEQIKRHRQEIIIFANVHGDEIQRVNKLLNAIEIDTREQTISSYNISMLNDIGCSAWLEYLGDFNEEDLNDFYKGLRVAINNINSSHDGDCMQRLTESLPEIRE